MARSNIAELIRMNRGESLGWYSEEGFEANNKDIRNYLEHLGRKCDSNIMRLLCMMKAEPAIRKNS